MLTSSTSSRSVSSWRTIAPYVNVNSSAFYNQFNFKVKRVKKNIIEGFKSGLDAEKIRNPKTGGVGVSLTTRSTLAKIASPDRGPTGGMAI